MNKVGILIPTIDRPDFVLRQLEFYKQNKCEHRIYIGDSSIGKNKDLLEAKLSHFQDILNINYFNWPNKNDRQTIADLADNVEEEFCTFAGDDDFLIPSSISLCSEFLSNNKDYATAQGKALLFVTKNNHVYEKIDELYVYWDRKEAIENSASKRIQNFSKNYWVPQFSVHRTSNFVDCSQDYRNISERHVGEYLHCFAFIATGKSKSLDCLHMMRQHHPSRGLSRTSPTTIGIEKFNSKEWSESAQIL